MRVKAVYRHSPGQRRTSDAGTASVKQYPRLLVVACEMPHSVAPDDLGKRSLRAARGDTQQIQYTAPGLGNHVVWQVPVAQSMDEFGQIHGTGPFQRWFFTGLDAVAWGFGYGSMPRLQRVDAVTGDLALAESREPRLRLISCLRR